MKEPVKIPVERMLYQHLSSLQQAGLTHLPQGEAWAVHQSVLSCPADQQTDASRKQTANSQPSHQTEQPADEAHSHSLEPGTVPNLEPCTLSLTERTAQLKKWAKKVSQCQRCSDLAEARTQTVFGVGNPEAKIMFVGEAPGADEDKQGEPFVGRAGKLLDKIIEAAQLTREEIYICNILRCRPPQNRNPSPQEAANCREYLDAQIATVDPDFIVCWGSVAAKSLLNVSTAIGKMRQQFYHYGRARVVCTYHPSYLLRNPPAKKEVWADIKWFRKEMGVELE